MIDLTKMNLADLGAVRQRLGADNENDDSMDDIIAELSPEDYAGKVSGWMLGDESWAGTFINIYKEALENSIEEK